MIIQYSMQIVNRLRATPRPEEQIFLPNDETWPLLPFRGPKDLQTKSPLTEGALRFHSEGAELLKITSARRVSLRCVSRGRARARTEISPQWEISL